MARGGKSKKHNIQDKPRWFYYIAVKSFVSFRPALNHTVVGFESYMNFQTKYDLPTNHILVHLESKI